MKDNHTLSFLEERNAFLLKERQAALAALETARDLSYFTASLTELASVEEIFREAAAKMRSLESFGALAFFIASEDDPTLAPVYTDPPEALPLLEREKLPLIEDRTIAWVLRQKKPVKVPTSDGKRTLFLHAVATSSQILGIFMGILVDKVQKKTEEEEGTSYPDFLSILLATTAGLVENLLLSRKVSALNESLKEKIIVLEKSQAELTLYRDNLERQVSLRTLELGLTNQELRREMDERKRIEEEIRHQAFHDGLTGLANRRFFYLRLEEILGKDSSGAVFFLDIDGFKGINDTLGHDAGDLLLQEVASRISSEVQEEDCTARMGGDEFAVVVHSLSSRRDIEMAAGRILRKIARKANIAGHQVSVSASMGICLFPEDGNNPVDLMKYADIAMYWSKEHGKNRSTFWKECSSPLNFSSSP